MLATGEIPSPSVDLATVTVLRPPEDISAKNLEEIGPAAPPSFHAAIVSVEDPIMTLRARSEVPVYSALKIETGDALWFGETESCQGDDGGWKLRVRLRHVLRDFDTLAQLAERFGTAPLKRISVQA